MMYKSCFLNFLLVCALSFLPAFAREVEIRTPAGDNFVMEVAPDETVLHFLGQIEEMLDPAASDSNVIVEGELVPGSQESTIDLFEQQKFILEFSIASAANDNVKKSTSISRLYEVPVSKEEKKNISYIVTTLANKSLVKILSLKSSIEKAGDKVNHVHPLRFLMCIFTDEELKVCVHNVMGRGWVWKDFMKGLSTSLDEEAKAGNMKDEYINDFAQKVGIDIGLIYPLIQSERWEDFIKILSVYIPRQGNPDRYDM